MEVTKSNKAIAEIIFDRIRKFGFKPTNIDWVNAYFIFESKDDNIVHFTVKGLRGWKFAIWIYPDNTDFAQISIFTQHVNNIDKFKPSRSYFLVEYTMDDFKEEHKDGWFYQLQDMLKCIKKHPIMSYVNDDDRDDYPNYYYTIRYISIRFYQAKVIVERFLKDWIPYIWTWSKVQMFKRNHIIQKVEIEDGNRGGFISYPRFSIFILFKDVATAEQEVKLLNRWFRGDNCGGLCLRYGNTKEGTYRYEENK